MHVRRQAVHGLHVVQQLNCFEPLPALLVEVGKQNKHAGYTEQGKLEK